MTAEGPDGYRYLVRRDGALVREGPVILDELDPASARIVRALIEAKAAGDRERAEVGDERWLRASRSAAGLPVTTGTAGSPGG